MKLLSFSVKNHLSIRETQSLVFHKPWHKSAEPDAGWDSITTPVTVLMGANAAGKSNVLNAIDFALGVVRNSATTWRSLERTAPLPHFPFAFGKDSRELSSAYEFDFVFADRRYLYGFEWSAQGVKSEWLSYVPKTRWTSIFQRDETGTYWNKNVITTRDQRAFDKVNARELVLSVALRDGIGNLSALAGALAVEPVYLPVGEKSADERVRHLIKMIRSGELQLERLSQLMAAADTGIVRVDLDEQRIPPDILVHMGKIIAGLRADGTVSAEELESAAVEASQLRDSELETLVDNFVFMHQGAAGEQRFGLAQESTGTQSWLAMGSVIVDALETGRPLLIDELDASLHQSLVELVLRAFTDSSINTHGAQLIFSTHNTNFLEHAHELGLVEEGIWFVDKDEEGVTELYSLAGFENHPKANYERRYLGGRYGALPQPSLATIRALVGA